MSDIKEEINQILERPEQFENDEEIVGLEEEYSIVDSEYNTVSQEVRDSIIDGPKFAEEEFGSFIAEIETGQFNTSDLNGLRVQLEERENQLAKVAAEYDAQLVRYGTNPFLDIDDFRHTRDGGRYREFSDFLERNRNSFVDSEFGDSGIDPRDIGYSGMITSTQLNIQAKSLEDAVDKTNYLYMISPYVVAATGNARILEKEDTGFNDLRVPLWEKSADTRTEDEFMEDEEPRVGRINSYYEDAEDYFERLDKEGQNSLKGAIKSNWKDTKMKFYGDDAVVEARPVSMQPSVEDDIAAHAFYIGRLNYAQENEEDLMSVNLVNRNREKAFRNGLSGELYDVEDNLRDAQDVVIEEISKAEKGLDYLDADIQSLEPLKQRVEQGYTPSRQSAEELYELGPDASPEEVVETVNRL